MATTSHGTRQVPPPSAVDQSCSLIEKVLGVSAQNRKSDKGIFVDRGLYVIKQGSSYVSIAVLPYGDHHALVKVLAQVVSGVRPEPSLFRQLLILNTKLRFGAFAYDPNGEVILFGHTLLGGSTLDANELSASVRDVALMADSYDDRIVARYGGQRMQDVVEESAWAHLLNPDESPAIPPLHPDDDDLPEDFVSEHTKRIRPLTKSRGSRALGQAAEKPAANGHDTAADKPQKSRAPARSRTKTVPQTEARKKRT